ncbi:hypothetical protein Ccrd_025210 [Cynara cardunculus var. scolymus]|uniref:Uncharacterized protein n=1 Tax=Cynara cardunculus var. scolymus TaxID=59895 RepID=A0A118JS97_CYNCS|nr:hypothetical protein Ccrd_025210 [Cynara cardunculus var. scolymus]
MSSNKKMKRVAFDPSPHVSYEDARARFKHQTLLQDFLELQQQKKLTLQAEVRFLRRRHKFLLKDKSSNPPQEQVSTQFTKSKKELDRSKKLRKLPPQPTEKKKKAPPSPEFDLNLGISLHGVKEQRSIHRGIAHQRVRINGPKVSTFLDLTQRPTHKPVIDLNQISREEEELQELFDAPTRGMIQNEQRTNVSYDPIYRNIGSGSGSGSGSGRAGKRKISWQDPVALRV